MGHHTIPLIFVAIPSDRVKDSYDEELVILLRGRYCDIYLGREDIFIDSPRNSGIVMALSFGINLDLVGLYKYWQEWDYWEAIEEFGL